MKVFEFDSFNWIDWIGIIEFNAYKLKKLGKKGKYLVINWNKQRYWLEILIIAIILLELPSNIEYFLV